MNFEKMKRFFRVGMRDRKGDVIHEAGEVGYLKCNFNPRTLKTENINDIIKEDTQLSDAGKSFYMSGF